MAKAPKQIAGYVRCGVLHVESEWKIEVLDVEANIAAIDVETEDGVVSFAVTKEAVKHLHDLLGLLLEEPPREGRKQ